MDEDTKRLIEGVAERIEGLYDLISRLMDTPGAYHECRVCGATRPHQPGDGGYYTRHGWPRHCGRAMRFVQPAEQKRNDHEHECPEKG